MSPQPPLGSASSRSLEEKDGQVSVSARTSTQLVEPAPKKRDRRFGLIFLALWWSIFVSALQDTIVSIALPTIVDDLKGKDFVWVGSAYALAATALLPLSGALSELFGRRITMLFSIGLFSLGSALSGAAQNMSWLIAARTIQGAGGGSMQAVSTIILSDLVPLNERASYNAILGMAFGVAATVGPLIGGACATGGQWRWIFYLDLPVCGIAAALVFFFLKLRTPQRTFKEKMARMDWIGNAIIIGSSTAVTIALTWGGIQFAWTSARVLVPLIVGLCGLAFWLLYERKWATYPIVPYRLLSNRTSLSGYIQTFITPIPVFATSFYLGPYYQACKGASPLRAGVLELPITLVFVPALVGGGISIKATQAYRPQLIVAWCILVLSMATLATVHADTPLAHPLAFSALVTLGAGISYAGTYFPVLAPLDVRDNAYALSFFAYLRQFAAVWGITIGGAILQNQLRHNLPPSFVSELPSGVAFAFSAIPLLSSLPEPLRTEVRKAFGDGFAVIYQVLAGIVGVGLIASLFMKSLRLHTQVDERWGLEDKDKNEEAVSPTTVGEEEEGIALKNRDTLVTVSAPEDPKGSLERESLGGREDGGSVRHA